MRSTCGSLGALSVSVCGSNRPVSARLNVSEPGLGFKFCQFVESHALEAGLSSDGYRWNAALTLCSIIILLIIAIILARIELLLILVVPPLLLKCSIRSLANRRSLDFENDYPALLHTLSSSIRAGMEPTAALLSSTDLFNVGSVMWEELNKVQEEIKRGATEESAVRSFGVTVRNDDLQMFRTAFLLAKRQGSSLGASLHRLVKVTRNRQSFRRKMRSALAIQRLSAVGISLSVVAIALIQLVGNSSGFYTAIRHPVAAKVLIFGLSSIIGGIVWIVKICTTRM